MSNPKKVAEYSFRVIANDDGSIDTISNYEGEGDIMPMEIIGNLEAEKFRILKILAEENSNDELLDHPESGIFNQPKAQA